VFHAQPILLAFAAAAILIAVAWRPWNRDWNRGLASSWAPLLTALAFASSLALAQVALDGMPTIPPSARWHWLGILVALSLVLEPLERRLEGKRLPALLGCLVLGAWFLWTTTGPKREYTWDGRETAFWLGGALIAWLEHTASMRDLARRRGGGPSLPLVLFACIVGLAVVLGLTGSVNFAHLAGSLAPALGGLVILGAWRPDLAALPYATGPLATAFLGLLWIGILFAEVPIAVALLLLAAPEAARLPAWGPDSGWKATIPRLVGAALLIAAAAVLAMPEDSYY
jgi:hypothetical protein